MSFMPWQLRKLNVVNGAKSGMKRNSFVTNKENARLITNELSALNKGRYDTRLGSYRMFSIKKNNNPIRSFFSYSQRRSEFLHLLNNVIYHDESALPPISYLLSIASFWSIQ